MASQQGNPPGPNPYDMGNFLDESLNTEQDRNTSFPSTLRAMKIAPVLEDENAPEGSIEAMDLEPFKMPTEMLNDILYLHSALLDHFMVHQILVSKRHWGDTVNESHITHLKGLFNEILRTEKATYRWLAIYFEAYYHRIRAKTNRIVLYQKMYTNIDVEVKNRLGERENYQPARCKRYDSEDELIDKYQVEEYYDDFRAENGNPTYLDMPGRASIESCAVMLHPSTEQASGSGPVRLMAASSVTVPSAPSDPVPSTSSGSSGSSSTSTTSPGNQAPQSLLRPSAERFQQLDASPRTQSLLANIMPDCTVTRVSAASKRKADRPEAELTAAAAVDTDDADAEEEDASQLPAAPPPKRSRQVLRINLQNALLAARTAANAAARRVREAYSAADEEVASVNETDGSTPPLVTRSLPTFSSSSSSSQNAATSTSETQESGDSLSGQEAAGAARLVDGDADEEAADRSPSSCSSKEASDDTTYRPPGQPSGKRAARAGHKRGRKAMAASGAAGAGTIKGGAPSTRCTRRSATASPAEEDGDKYSRLFMSHVVLPDEPREPLVLGQEQFLALFSVYSAEAIEVKRQSQRRLGVDRRRRNVVSTERTDFVYDSMDLFEQQERARVRGRKYMKTKRAAARAEEESKAGSQEAGTAGKRPAKPRTYGGIRKKAMLKRRAASEDALAVADGATV